MPLQLWVQAAHARLRVKEVAVPRLYLDPTRAFGGVFDDAEQRLAYYREVIARAEAALASRPALPGILAACCASPCPPLGACS
jgi:dolichol-phosphate mannosyltransferase